MPIQRSNSQRLKDATARNGSDPTSIVISLKYEEMKKLQKALALMAMAAIMPSCGTVGLLIHTAKIMDSVNHSINYGQGGDWDTIRFVINGENRMVFKAEVNGQKDTVMYDSGVNSNTLLMYTPSTKPEGMKFYRHSVLGADKRSKIKMTTIPLKIKTEMVESEGLGFAMLNPETHYCDKESRLDKYNIIGFQGLNIRRYMMDFTNGQIYYITDSVVIDTTEFVPVKCKYHKNVLWVYPRINGVEYECIFDTGNGAASFLLADEQRVASPMHDDMVYEGSFGQAIGGLTDFQRFVIAQQETIELAGKEDAGKVMYVKSIAHNNMGLSAISKYDWIIEQHYDRNVGVIKANEIVYKMYARPHSKDAGKPFKAPAYRVSTADGTLKILTRRIDGNEKFKVGDQIISVNGEKITEENICYYYDLLTEAKDWSEFEIRVK